PTGWFFPPVIQGYGAKISGEGAKTGKRCAVVYRDPAATAGPNDFGNLMQSFEAGPFRGKRVRLRAAIRAEVSGAGSQAMMWLRVDRKDGQPGFFDNMADRPVTAKEWRYYEIVGEVAADAETINLGLMLIGSGKAYLDDVSFTVLEKGAG